jgi:alkanesulfonate monooxygenase SsuD/methylene tetrahydromethanopterin reductase-like flavin-dependent oxidoreductase (luciferase family)
MATVMVASTREEADAKVQAAVRAGANEELVRMMGLIWPPDDIAAQAQEFLDAGIDGLTVSLPDVHDLDSVALVGETLGPLVKATARS